MTCAFGISIFCDAKSKNWYIGFPRNKQSGYHINHLKVDPKHVVTHRSELCLVTKQTIKNLIESGSSNSSIMDYLSLKFNITTSMSQISSFRNDMIIDIIKDHPSFTSSPYADNLSSVDRLIKLFESMKNVTYVYVKHSMMSGFVTFTRTKSEKTLMSESIEADVNSWRKALQIGDSQDILVSFAWCHDDEKRQVVMFPELLSGDMAFGLNRERRNLIIFAGVNGNNEAYTAFRCWMPSKQSVAYQWAIGVALPSIIGENVTSRNKIITSDAEPALVTAFLNTIQSPNGSFVNAKYRTDFYHLVTQRWNKIIHANSNDRSHHLFPEYSKVVYLWIKSWISYVESQDEFNVSYNKLQGFLNLEKNILGHTFVAQIKSLIIDVVSRIQHVGNHHFLYTTTFGFLGSSVVESTNFSLKYGDRKCKPNMGLDRSSLNQLNQVETKSFKSNIKMAAQMNETTHHSRSLTNDYLTRYMEGLAIKNFDERINYVTSYIGNYEWHVMDKDMADFVIEDSKSHSNPNNKRKKVMSMDNCHYTKFIRVRKVRVVSDKFITCSCGYVQRYLAPCRHVMAVLQKREFVIPSLFHIRWFKQFHYYFGNDICPEEMKEVHESMKELFNKCHNEFYDNRGRYYGCNVQGNKFLLQKFIDDESCEYSQVMKTINDYSMTKGPIKYGDKEFYNHLPWIEENEGEGGIAFDNQDDINDDEFQNIVNEVNEHGFGMRMHDDTFINGQTVLGNLSQQSVELDSLVTQSTTNRVIHEKGDDLWNSVQSFMSTIKTEDQKKRFITFMRDEGNRNINENNPQYSHPNSTTLMIGSDESGRADSGKRIRQVYERNSK